jgi:hypothetical protein
VRLVREVLVYAGVREGDGCGAGFIITRVRFGPTLPISGAGHRCPPRHQPRRALGFHHEAYLADGAHADFGIAGATRRGEAMRWQMWFRAYPRGS